ncbi:MAG: hypothetical protein RIF37_00600 [Rhodospirillaceae bacterium]
MTDLATEWVRCRHWLGPALERSRRFFSEADVVDGLVQGTYFLRGGKASAIVYTLTDYPMAKAMVFLLAGGALEDIAELETDLIEHARTLGCDRVEFCGRRGWTRALGYTEAFCIGIKDI